MQILLKLFLLLINVNEENSLDLLENENLITNLESSIQHATIGQASVSTDISLQSLKSVFQSLIDYYKIEGFGFYDIQNVIFIITFIQFYAIWKLYFLVL